MLRSSEEEPAYDRLVSGDTCQAAPAEQVGTRDQEVQGSRRGQGWCGYQRVDPDGQGRWPGPSLFLNQAALGPLWCGPGRSQAFKRFLWWNFSVPMRREDNDPQTPQRLVRNQALDLGPLGAPHPHPVPDVRPHKSHHLGLTSTEEARPRLARGSRLGTSAQEDLPLWM